MLPPKYAQPRNGGNMSAESSAAQSATIESHIEELRGRDDDTALTGLQTRIETLERQLREQPKPVRISAKTITVVGSLIAAVIPLTTAIDGWLKWRADPR